MKEEREEEKEIGGEKKEEIKGGKTGKEGRRKYCNYHLNSLDLVNLPFLYCGGSFYLSLFICKVS